MEIEIRSRAHGWYKPPKLPNTFISGVFVEIRKRQMIPAGKAYFFLPVDKGHMTTRTDRRK